MAMPVVPTPNPNPTSDPSNPSSGQQPMEFPRQPVQPERNDPKANPRPTSKPPTGQNPSECGCDDNDKPQ